MKPGRWFRRFAALLFAAIGAVGFAAPRIPLEDFVRDPDFARMQMSPDGLYTAFLREYNDHSSMYVGDLATMTTLRFDLGLAPAYGALAPKEAISYAWISDRRLIMTTTVWDSWFGVRAVNRDGTAWKGISGLETLPTGSRIMVNISEKDFLWAWRKLYAFEDADQNILMLDEHNASGQLRLYPDVVKVNTLTGSSTTMVKNPGNVTSWGVDHDGHIRIGATSEGGLKFGVIYRDDEKAPWRKLSLPREMREIRVVEFDRTNQHLYVAALSPEKRVALFQLDLGANPQSQVVLSDPEYDIVPQPFTATPSIDGISLSRVIFSESKRALVGVWYLRDAPRVQWFDKDFIAYQHAVDRRSPNTINLYVDHSRDDKRVLFLAFSDRDPGTYYLLDAEKKTIRPLAPRMPQIKPAQMAEMLSVQYPARDGLVIHGYLTLPVGSPPHRLPLIIMPHGGPWVRDVWGFDPLVQMLANRGYAVLQMNYRGSPGYGQEFFAKGKLEVGAAIQNDIEDATRWAIAKGLADPQRVAIVGASYGGYSVLFALGHNPDLYKCGISIAGVADWVSIYTNLSDPEYKFAREHWKENIGDPRTDQAFLRSISPVNFADKITAPLLIIQGKEDRIVPPKQARAMIAALEQAGRKPESLFLADDGHGLTSKKARLAGFKTIESFLERNLGPGVPPLEPDKPAVAPAPGGK
jgi:dipeptidyl aminopeptidase/acylaminoacyl peptidase